MRKHLVIILIGFLALASACNQEEKVPALTIDDIKNTVTFQDGILNVMSIITFNRNPGSVEIFYDTEAVDNDNPGLVSVVEDNVVELSTSIEISQDLSIGLVPSVNLSSGITLTAESIIIIASENGDFWLKIKEYPIESRPEDVIPFVFGDKVFLAGLDAFDVSRSIPYEIDMTTLEIEEKERMPISTYRTVGFQLGDFGYVGACIFEEEGDGVRSCSGDYITYMYNSGSEKWEANSDILSDPGAFKKQQQVSFNLNGKAHLYDGSFGLIYQFDEVNQKWDIIANTDARAGSPIAEIVNGSLYVGIDTPGLLHELNPGTGEIINSYEYPGSEIPTFNDIYVGSFVNDGKIYISFGENYFFDTETKEWGNFAFPPGFRTEFFTYQGSIYQVSYGEDIETREPSTLLWRYHIKNSE